MIIKSHQIKNIIHKNHKFFVFLIYGPNEGLIRETIINIKQEYSSFGNYDEIIINDKNLKDDKSFLHNSIFTNSLFFENKIILIENLKDSNWSEVEDIINRTPDNTAILLKNDNLSKSSKIRKFFETSQICFSVACYEDDTRDVMRNIDKFMLENKININRDVKNFLLNSLSSDRMISNQELEKIAILYSGSENKIDLESIKEIFNDSSSNNLGIMNKFVMFGNTEKSSKLINRLLLEGTSPISIIRSITNYLIRIKNTQVEMKKGSRFEEAIKILRPPVFWKEKDDFQKHCANWSSSNVDYSLSNLMDTEVECKLNSKLAKLYCEKSIAKIALIGKKAFRA